jgi:hypothetical protein
LAILSSPVPDPSSTSTRMSPSPPGGHGGQPQHEGALAAGLVVRTPVVLPVGRAAVTRPAVRGAGSQVVLAEQMLVRAAALACGCPKLGSCR